MKKWIFLMTGMVGMLCFILWLMSQTVFICDGWDNSLYQITFRGKYIYQAKPKKPSRDYAAGYSAAYFDMHDNWNTFTNAEVEKKVFFKMIDIDHKTK